MSKRKTTPNLPSMDDLLGGGIEEPKSRGVQTPRRRVKVTYYLPADLVDRIDEVHFKLNRATRVSGSKIHKYDMAEIAMRLLLDDFDERGTSSDLATILLPDT